MKTHCGRGHPLSGENLSSYTYGERLVRVCKACAKLRAEAHRQGETVPPAPIRQLPERLWSRAYINRITGCVVWMGGTTSKGYGHMKVEERWRYVHRLSYELLVGPIPPEMTVDHLCWNQRCIAPAHLELCTRRENTQRMHERS